MNATHVVLETPTAGSSNLHYYLVTYWARVKPESFNFGGYLSDLPDELLDRIGKNLNMVIIEQVVPGTPAAAAGLRGGDVILAVNETHVPDTKTFVRTSRRGGSKPRQSANSRPGINLKQTMQQLQGYGTAWGKEMDRQRQQNVKIFLENAPNAHSGWGRFGQNVKTYY